MNWKISSVVIIILLFISGCSSKDSSSILNGEFQIMGENGISYLDFDTNTISSVYDNTTNDYQISVVENSGLKLIDKKLFFIDDSKSSMYSLDVTGNNLKKELDLKVDGFQTVTVKDYLFSKSNIVFSLTLSRYDAQSNNVESFNTIAIYNFEGNNFSVLEELTSKDHDYSVFYIDEENMYIKNMDQKPLPGSLTRNDYNQDNKSKIYEKYIQEFMKSTIQRINLDSFKVEDIFSGSGITSVEYINDTFFFVDTSGINSHRDGVQDVIVQDDNIPGFTFINEDFIVYRTMIFEDDYVSTDYVYDLNNKMMIEELNDYSSKSNTGFVLRDKIGDYFVGYCNESNYCFIKVEDFMNSNWKAFKFNDFDGYVSEE